jgi:orotidine-5'-phosphate decarboxylase
VSSFSVGNRLIAALDVHDEAAAEALIGRLHGIPTFYKIGLELYYQVGPELVRSFAERKGLAIMLDLKLHDIPETVARATKRIASLGAKLLTVHASGGRAMLEAAVEAAGPTGPRVLAVTALTSLDAADLGAIGVSLAPREWAVQLAGLAHRAGCAGVVSSVHEAAAIRAATAPDFLVVTPGIRPPDLSAGDQKRVATPAEARRAGADLLVVGRPLRDADEPAAVAQAIVDEIARA